MNFKMTTGEDFTIQTKGGYTLTAPNKTGTLATIGDVSNVEVIELEDTEIDESTTSLPAGIYDTIAAAVDAGKTVVLNAFTDGGPAKQFYLSYIPELYDDYVTLSTIPDEGAYYQYLLVFENDGCEFHTDTLEAISRKVTSLSSLSTDNEYPSAKCVYDIVGDIETLINAL